MSIYGPRRGSLDAAAAPADYVDPA